MRLVGRVVRWVGASLESLRRLNAAQRLWQMGVIILQAAAQAQGGGAQGFSALQATIQGWLSGSQGAALAIANILPTIGTCCVQAAAGVGRPASY